MTKVHLSVQEQLELLDSRGMEIENREIACASLSSFGYYRLSGYWYQYRFREEVNGEAE